MNFDQLLPFRTMRSRLHTALKRGRLAVLDIGSSKITCLVLRLDPARLARSGGYGAAELQQIERIVRAQEQHLLRAWHEYFTVTD